MSEETQSTTSAPNPFLAGLGIEGPAAQPLQAEPVAQETQTQDGAPPADHAPDVPEAPKPAEPPLSSRFAAAARIERELRQKERAIKDAEAKLQAREAALAPVQKAKERVAEDPEAALAEALGMSYEQLTDLILQKQAPETVSPRELAAREAKRVAEQEWKRLQQEAEQASAAERARQYETLAETRRREFAQIAAAEGEKYELAHVSGAAPAAWERIEQHWQANGQLLEPDAAIAQVETSLAEELKTLLTQSAKARQIAQSIIAATAQPRPTPGPQSQPKTTLAPTLTNRGVAEVPAVTREPSLPDSEAIARAAKLLRW